LVELDKDSWHPGERRVQWTYLSSERGVLRGPHLHKQHIDNIVLLRGELYVALADLRADASTAGMRVGFVLEPLQVLTIPAVIAHGFLSLTPTAMLNGTSHEFDPQDDLEVRFDDQDLSLPWPAVETTLSARDDGAPTLRVLLDRCADAGLAVIAAGD
jgi:dTDP-4-dehydrorhamnose 3,5-epimerase